MNIFNNTKNELINYYKENLKFPSEAMSFLTEKWNLSDETIAALNIGFAPEALIDFKKKSKVQKIHMHLKNRIIFPSYDKKGNILGITGRKLPNTEEGAVYNILCETDGGFYNLNNAIASKEKFFIICEGICDVVALYNVGIENVISPIKDNFTLEHVKTLSKYGKKILIVFDSDEYGRKKAKKAEILLTNSGIEVMNVKLKEAVDICEFIKGIK